MKNIEIATAHNIVFKYELASILQRILANIIDLAILFFYSFFTGVIFSSHSFLLYTFIILVVTFYHLLCELFWDGQSIGKKILKIRVVTLNGTTPTASDFFTRWIFRMIDVTFSFGTLAIFAIIGSDKNQRIGDLLAQTTVVSLSSTIPVSLSSINKLNENEGTLNLSGITQFTDEDMLLLKHALQRFKTSKTDANKSVLSKIGTEIYETLGIKDKTVSVDQLQAILNEYVLKTR